jgi:hypothetical protein
VNQTDRHIERRGAAAAVGNAVTMSRLGARSDPGDEIFARLIAAGAEPVLAGQRQDLELGKVRQAALVARGEQLEVDGLVGPASLAAARRQGVCPVAGRADGVTRMAGDGYPARSLMFIESRVGRRSLQAPPPLPSLMCIPPPTAARSWGCSARS